MDFFYQSPLENQRGSDLSGFVIQGANNVVTYGDGGLAVCQATRSSRFLRVRRGSIVADGSVLF